VQEGDEIPNDVEARVSTGGDDGNNRHLLFDSEASVTRTPCELDDALLVGWPKSVDLPSRIDENFASFPKELPGCHMPGVDAAKTPYEPADPGHCEGRVMSEPIGNLFDPVDPKDLIAEQKRVGSGHSPAMIAHEQSRTLGKVLQPPDTGPEIGHQTGADFLGNKFDEAFVARRCEDRIHGKRHGEIVGHN
jgi:hypothetical protein